MQKLQLHGYIDEKGSFTIQNRQRLLDWAAQNPGKSVVVKFERKGSKRSSPQNRYYWGVVIADITTRLRDLGYQWITEEDVHAMMKIKFNYDRIISEEGEALELPKSTTDLTKTQFAEYIENIRMWAAGFLSIDIPDPNKDLTMQF